MMAMTSSIEASLGTVTTDEVIDDSTVGHRILALGDNAAHDIAIGDHANRTVGAVDDWNFSAVVLRHELRDLVERRAR